MYGRRAKSCLLVIFTALSMRCIKRKGFLYMNDCDKKKIMGASLIALCAVFAVIGAFVQALAVLFGYDASMQVFKRNSAISASATAVLVLFSAVLAALSIAASVKYDKTRPVRAGAFTSFLSVCGGCVALLSSLALLCEIGTGGGMFAAITIFLAVTSIFAGEYMVLSAVDVIKSERVLTVMSFFPPIWAASCLMRMYFETGSAINDPVRVLLQLSLVFVMLSLLFETKMKIKGNGFAAFAATATVSLILCCSASVSTSLLYLITKTVSEGELLLSLSGLIISLRLITRLGACFRTK